MAGHRLCRTDSQFVGMFHKKFLDSHRFDFAGIKKVKFRRKVIPGDTLCLEIRITYVKGPIGIGEGRAFVKGELACEAELMFALGQQSDSLH